MTSILRVEGGRVEGKAKNEMLSDLGGWRGLASVLDVQSLFFYIKENWICAMTRYHAKPNINILLSRNLPFDSDVRQ